MFPSRYEKDHVDGIVYFQSLTNPPPDKISRKQLGMLREILGEESFENLVIATTDDDRLFDSDDSREDRWCELSDMEGILQQLADDYAKRMHYDNSQDAAKAIFDYLLPQDDVTPVTAIETMDSPIDNEADTCQQEKDEASPQLNAPPDNGASQIPLRVELDGEFEGRLLRQHKAMKEQSWEQKKRLKEQKRRMAEQLNEQKRKVIVLQREQKRREEEQKKMDEEQKRRMEEQLREQRRRTEDLQEELSTQAKKIEDLQNERVRHVPLGAFGIIAGVAGAFYQGFFGKR